MARKRKEITITNEEKQKLQGIAKSRTAPRNAVERAKIILFVLDGKTNDEIAEKVQLSKSAINNTIKKWRIFGVNAALEDLARPGKPKVITNEAKMWVIHLGCQMPQNVPNGPPLQLWSMEALTQYVRAHCEKEGHSSLLKVSKSKIWSILNDNSLKPHQVKYYLVKKDPNFKEKAEVVLLLYKRVEWILQFTRDEVANGQQADSVVGETIVSYDEKPGIQAIMNIAPDLAPTSEHGYVARDYEYKRLGTVSLLAGIDLLNGKVTGLVRDSHRSSEFIEFLNLLDKKYDKSLVIRMILDNHSAHKSKMVLNYLAKKPGRFQFTFTPTHSSWLNLVESFFGKMARQCLNTLRVKSKEDLVDIITRWLEAVNNEPVVFRWKWKLEEIMSAFNECLY